MNSNAVGPRRRSREMALQLLFQHQFHVDYEKSESGRLSAEEMLRRFPDEFSVGEDATNYGAGLFLGVVENASAIDAIIQSHSAHWKVSRMGLVDLSIMRIAVFEMKFMKPPLNPKIAIDEAVEIAKKYGSTESSAFVNGILDHIARGL